MSDVDTNESKPPVPSQNKQARLHDLDALRAFAMLLGIVLHAGLAYAPNFPWIVQDSQPSEWIFLVYPVIHGFRMPLFFLLSGYFTAMLWRRRGLQRLLAQRSKRILLPLLLAMVTIVPLNIGIGIWIFTQPARDAAAENAAEVARADSSNKVAAERSDNYWDAARRNEPEIIRELSGEGKNVNVIAPRTQMTPLTAAALFGSAEAAKALLEVGADPNRRGNDGGTALHGAAFFGRARIVELLLEAGADPLMRNHRGEQPLDVIKADWNVTAYIARLVDVNVDRAEVDAGRSEVASLLESAIFTLPRDAVQSADRDRRANAAADSVGLLDRLEAFTLSLGRRPLFSGQLFHHLWFLWFLCWLVLLFVVYAFVTAGIGGRWIPRWLLLSPMRLLLLVPLTVIPHWFMGLAEPGFGPDTSTGLLPMPAVLFYYAIFFFFGAVYYDADDRDRKVGRFWVVALPLALLVLLPLGLELTWGIAGYLDALGLDAFEEGDGRRLCAIVVQATYAWLMCFGFLGICSRFLAKESRLLRYLSDSAYWLYLAHVPLIMWGQQVMRDLLWPAEIKLVVLLVGTTTLLLAAYQIGVRYTWLGRLLNGPRIRPDRARNAIESAA